MISLPDFVNKVKSFLKQVPEEKRHIVLICAGGGIALLIFFVILIAMNNRNEARTAGRAGVIRHTVIPAEELFLPDEPDFVPGVLLEREQRPFWTEQDAAAYWRDPLKNGEEEWRENVEAAIDALLERVP
jgi:hypothetical protein